MEPDFRSAVAFYPDCRISSGLGWSARVPTLVLIGAGDDVSSPPACRQMVDGARGRSALARIVVYPNAVHDFDRANFPLHAIAGTDAGVPERGHSAAIPKPAPIRKSASRNGWGGSGAFLKQTALIDRLGDALGRGGLRLARGGFRRACSPALPPADPRLP